MAVLTRLGVYSISGADLTFADADMLSGMSIVNLGDGQIAVFGVSPS